MLSEFKPALIFLGKFLGAYLVGNLLYAWYINAYLPSPDPATRAVTAQSSWCLSVGGESVTMQDHLTKPSIAVMSGENNIINVFEGCNGINVMIIFVAFIFAFGGPRKATIWFVPMGLLIIHLINLLRIALLYFTAKDYQSYFYYVHKYFFTAILYVVVFVLWAIWVMVFNRTKKSEDEGSPT